MRQFYILSEGEESDQRLKFQHELVKGKVLHAFKQAILMLAKKDITVLDFGCGTSTAYEDIMKVTNQCQYVGVDVSEKQIAFNKKNFPEARYIIGNENDKQVINALGDTDIVYLRYVVMHQKHPEEFIRKIFDSMRNGAVLIIQDPEETIEQKNEMINKYPFAGDLCEFKKKLGSRLGIDYNFAKYLGATLENFDTKQLMHKTDPLYVPICQAKEFMRNGIEEVLNKKTPNPVLTRDEAEHYFNILYKLPSDRKNVWLLDMLHTFVIQKS